MHFQFLIGDLIQVHKLHCHEFLNEIWLDVSSIRWNDNRYHTQIGSVSEATWELRFTDGWSLHFPFDSDFSFSCYNHHLPLSTAIVPTIHSLGKEIKKKGRALFPSTQGLIIQCNSAVPRNRKDYHGDDNKKKNDYSSHSTVPLRQKQIKNLIQ